jgi:TrmH family RNA methyltransferase
MQRSIFKHCLKLRKDRAYRAEQGRALIVGATLARECAPLHRLITTTDEEIETKERIETTPDIVKRLAGTASAPPMVAEVDIPPLVSLKATQRILALDHLADPGNLGTLLRTALALGFDGALLIEGVDPFNDKAIAASKGAVFRLPLSRESLDDLPHRKYVADLGGDDIESVTWNEPAVLILGNESHGPSRWEGATRITIPMSGMDSLNVAIAGGILMHAMRCHAR